MAEDDDLNRSDETAHPAPSTRKRHLSPNDPSSERHRLLNDDRVKQFKEDFEDLFWKVNAPADLDTFRSFCVNLLDIINEAQLTWGTIEEDPGVSRWIPCLEWIMNASTETALFKDFSPYKTTYPSGVKEEKLSFLGKGMTRHQVYGTILFRHVGDDASKRKYRLLVAHLIFGHAQMMMKIGKENYETYVKPESILKHYAKYGEPEISKKVSDPTKAATAVRFLAEASDWLYRADLLLLPPLLLIKEFERNPPNIESSRSRDFELFLQLAYGLRELKASGGEGRGGSAWIHGKSWITDGYEPFGDQDDPTDVRGRRLSQRKASDSDVGRSSDAEFSDDCDDEDDDGTGETLETVAVKAGSDLWEAAIAHSRHVERNNQRFRWEYDTLAAEEVQSLISKVTQDALHQADSTPLNEKAWKHIEVAALLNVMFWMARPLEQARRLVVSSFSITSNHPLGLQLTPDGGIWRVKAPLPDRVRPFVVSRYADRERSEYLEICDRGNALGLFRPLHERNKALTIPDASSLPSHLFDIKQPSAWYTQEINKLLKSTPRLTKGRISNFLLSKLLEVSGGDVVASAIVSGRELSFARVKMYYACRSAEKLDELYRRTTDKVRTELGMAKLEECKAVQDPKLYITNQVCPTFDEMKSRVEDLKNKIYELSELTRKDPRDWIFHHNAYTLYTVWMFSFATGVRGIVTPYLDPAKIGKKDGIATLTDKDNSSGYKRRLIWIPEPVREQMKKYREFIRWSLRQPTLADKPCFFFLKGESIGAAGFREVRPSTQRAVLDELFGRNPDGNRFFNFPINTHRRFMLTELVEAGCPPQVCDAWMGHWYRAEEPWGPFSSFSHKNARRILQDQLPGLLERLGFVPLSTMPHKRMIKRISDERS